MEWSDVALVLGSRPHGEAAVVLELMTREHGRHLGLVHGGRGRRLRAALQPGNAVVATWRARLDEQLGVFAVEPRQLRAARLMGSALALHGLGALAAHLRLLPERDPYAGLHDAADAVAEGLDRPDAAERLARFELALLAELGFGLDLGSCAATGARTDLAYVSPRTGRAVSGAAGEPWRDRLLPLPAWLTGSQEGTPGPDGVAAAFRLTGHFLQAHVWEPRGLDPPPARARFITLAGAAPEPGGNARARLAESAADAAP